MLDNRYSSRRKQRQTQLLSSCKACGEALQDTQPVSAQHNVTFIASEAHLRVIGVSDAVGNVQKHRDAVSVARSTGLWKHFQQALPASWGQRGELQDLQRMPGNLIAVPARSCDIRQKPWGHSRRHEACGCRLSPFTLTSGSRALGIAQAFGEGA